MRVTDEIAARFVRAFNDGAFHDAEGVLEAIAVAKPALEAALSDVPEPPPVYAQLMLDQQARIHELEAWLNAADNAGCKVARELGARAEAADARVKELEAKLSHVTNLRDAYVRQTVGTGQRVGKPSDPYWMKLIAEQLTTILESP